MAFLISEVYARILSIPLVFFLLLLLLLLLYSYNSTIIPVFFLLAKERKKYTESSNILIFSYRFLVSRARSVGVTFNRDVIERGI